MGHHRNGCLVAAAMMNFKEIFLEILSFIKVLLFHFFNTELVTEGSLADWGGNRVLKNKVPPASAGRCANLDYTDPRRTSSRNQSETHWVLPEGPLHWDPVQKVQVDGDLVQEVGGREPATPDSGNEHRENVRREAARRGIASAQGWTRNQGPVGNDCTMDRIEHEEMKDRGNQCTRVP